jgi:SAM-dependent methyltransferase
MHPDFIAHNIRLDDGRCTMPHQARTLDQTSLVHATRRLLCLAFPAGLAGRSIIDVGCLEGGHTVEFARAGMVSTGLEVRASNFENCLYVQRNLSLPNLRFVQADANEIARHGPFDAVFASGLLYHLDKPRAFLAEASKACRRIILLHTHIAHAAETPARATYGLSPLAQNEGLSGRWYEEHDAPPQEQLNALREASWANTRSFWPEKQFLLQALLDVGFDTVFESFDCMENIVVEMTSGYYVNLDRVFIIGIKSEGFSGQDEPLDLMRRSTSWRITAPLRAAARLLKGPSRPT